MKNLLKEELNQIKYLFGYERGKVISEQNLLTEDTETLTLFESTLPEFWGDDFVEGTTFSEEFVSGVAYYIAKEPDGSTYYFYYYPNGNPENSDFKFIQYQHDEDMLVANEEPKTEKQSQSQKKPLLTTEAAKQAKIKALTSLDILLKGVAGENWQTDGDTKIGGLEIVKQQKYDNWRPAYDELKATNDDELCLEENKQKVKDKLTSSEELMNKYSMALTDKEKKECQKLIDGLKLYPEYCKS